MRRAKSREQLGPAYSTFQTERHNPTLLPSSLSPTNTEKPNTNPPVNHLTAQQQPPVSQMQNALSTAHTNSQEIQETATYIQPGLPLRWVANSHAKKTGRCVRSSRRFGFILGAITVAFELRPRSSLDPAGENLVTCLTVFYLAWLVVTASAGMTFENCVSVCLFVVRKYCNFWAYSGFFSYVVLCTQLVYLVTFI